MFCFIKEHRSFILSVCLIQSDPNKAVRYMMKNKHFRSVELELYKVLQNLLLFSECNNYERVMNGGNTAIRHNMTRDRQKNI